MGSVALLLTARIDVERPGGLLPVRDGEIPANRRCEDSPNRTSTVHR